MNHRLHRLALPLAAAFLVLAPTLSRSVAAPPPAPPSSPPSAPGRAPDSLAVGAPRLATGEVRARQTPAQALADSARRPVTLLPFRTATPDSLLTGRGAGEKPEGPPIPTSVPFLWRTRAERTGWRQTADYNETVRYCRQLEAGSRWIRFTTFGTSGQGRPLPLLIVSRDRAFTPEAARATGKPIVLIQNGIHSAEIEGKDASLALVRDMAILQTRANLLDSCIVLVIPIYSVDAHERRGRFNRINQNGPELMGWRTTPVGLNLNRDYMKAEAPETRALLANVYEKWWPELLVDNHTTDGADYQHDVTYGYAHGPAIPTALDHWYTDAFEGHVVPRLVQLGHLPAPYLSFRRGNDPASGIDFGSAPPRFSNGYTALQCRASILVETHMLKPYGTRVMATYDVLVALLEELRARPRALTGAVRDAEREVAARAKATGAGRNVVLAVRTTDDASLFAFRGKQTTWQKSPITGTPVAHYSSAPWDTIVPLYRDVTPTLTVTQPAGYLVPQEWSDAIALLQRQGVHLRRLASAWSDSVQMTRIAEWSVDPQPFEGHFPVRVKRVKSETQWRTWRPGDVWVPLDDRSALMAVHLCEAQAPDGLVAWNFFDTILQYKEYGEDYVVEPMALEMMAKDPALKREFETKLASDSTFAANPWARSDFFYRRSPWADPEQNLVPIARALRAVPENALVPETAGAGATPAK